MSAVLCHNLLALRRSGKRCTKNGINSKLERRASGPATAERHDVYDLMMQRRLGVRDSGRHVAKCLNLTIGVES